MPFDPTKYGAIPLNQQAQVGATAPRQKYVSEEVIKPQEQGGYFQQTLSNVPGSAGRLVGSVASLFKPSTVKQLGKIALGAIELALPGEGRDEEAARQVGRAYKERYGGLSNIKETFKEDPVGVAADVAGVLSLGSGVAAKAGSIARAGELAGTARALTTTSRALGTASRAVDPLIYAGKVLKSSLNVTGSAMAGTQRLAAGVLGLPEAAPGIVQKASGEAARHIAEGMRNSESAIPLISDIQKSVKALDDVVWKVGGEVARKYPGEYSAANVAPAAIEKLAERLGIVIEEAPGANGLFKGYKVIDGGPFSAATVKKFIVPTLEELRRFRETGMTVKKLWDKSKMVGTELEKVQKMTGGDTVVSAFLDAVHEAMPADFWPQIQAQGEVQRIGNAFKAALGQGGLEGYAATPGYRGQIAESRIGQMFGKNKTVMRQNVADFERVLRDQIEKLQAMTGKSIDELVQAGVLEKDVAELMKNPQIMNTAVGRVFSPYMPNVLRAISAFQGGLGGVAGGLVAGIPGAIAGALSGLAIASPRLQGELALALGKANELGGLGSLARRSTPGKLIWGNMPTYKQLRLLAGPNEQQR